MRRTGRVVADDGSRADEDAAGAPYGWQQYVRIRDVQLQMLGRELFRASNRSAEARNHFTQDVVIFDNESSDLVGQHRIVGQQQRGGIGAVLGLGEQAGGATLRHDGAVGDHDDLARPGREIDADRARRRAAWRR